MSHLNRPVAAQRVVVDLLQSTRWPCRTGRATPPTPTATTSASVARLGSTSEATAATATAADRSPRDTPDAVEQRRSAPSDGDELPTPSPLPTRRPSTSGTVRPRAHPPPRTPPGSTPRPHIGSPDGRVPPAPAQSAADTPEMAPHTTPDPPPIPDPAARDGQPADPSGVDTVHGPTPAGNAPVLLGVGTQILTATAAAAAAALPHYAHASAPTRTLDFVHRPPLTAPGRVWVAARPRRPGPPPRTAGPRIRPLPPGSVSSHCRTCRHTSPMTVPYVIGVRSLWPWTRRLRRRGG